MNFCIDAKSLRAALANIEKAEKNGFHHCLAVLKVVSGGPNLQDCKVGYSDLFERAHPTDSKLNWGRFQNVSGRNKFKDGKLVPIKGKK